MQPTPLFSVLFVCLGNICRSPAAEAVFYKLLQDNGVQNIFIDSCAVSSWNLGKLMDPSMVRACSLKGYGVSKQKKSRLIMPHDFMLFDYILACDTAVLKKLHEIEPSTSQSKISLLTAFSKQFPNQDIPDPYQKNLQAFEQALEMIEDSCKGLYTYLTDPAHFPHREPCV